MEERTYGGWPRIDFTGEIDEIRRLVANRPTEGIDLQYKSGPWWDEEKDHGKRNHGLAWNLAAFANAGGGLLVLGYYDNGRRLWPLKDTIGFEQLQQIVRGCIVPAFVGDLLALQEYEVDGGHVYAVLVGSSARAPHMIVSKGDHQGCYPHQTAGGIPEPMDHWQVQALMGRRQQPDLRLAESSSVWFDGNNTVSADVLLSVLNDGPAVAHTAAVALTYVNDEGLGHSPGIVAANGWLQSQQQGRLVRHRHHLAEPVIPGLPPELRFSWNVTTGGDRRILFETVVYCEGADPLKQRFLWRVDSTIARDLSAHSLLELVGRDFDQAEPYLDPEGFVRRARCSDLAT